MSVAVVAIAGVALIGVLLSSRIAAPTRPTWTSILPLPNGFDRSPDPIVSPDGRYVVFKVENESHTSLLWLNQGRAP
jgi:hypothetical protein